jgi:hypothetical protein
MELFDESQKVTGNKNHSKFAQKINGQFETIDKVYVKQKMSAMKLTGSPKIIQRHSSRADLSNIKINIGSSPAMNRASFITNRTNDSKDDLKPKKLDYNSEHNSQVFLNKFTSAINDKKKVKTIESTIMELSSKPSEQTAKGKKSIYSHVKTLESNRHSQSKLNPSANSKIAKSESKVLFPKLGQRTLSNFNVQKRNGEISFSIIKNPQM